LLQSEKRKLHARIADVLADKYPERAAREPELLAQHLTEAEEHGRAVDFWLKAGRRAARTYANLEAIAHLRRGIEVLQGDPSIAGRDGLELDLRIALGRPLIAAKGYAVPEVEDNYLRALELVTELNEKPRIVDAMQGLWVCYFIRGDLAKARDLGAQLLEIAEQADNEQAVGQSEHRTGQLVEAHRMLGQTMLYGGRLGEARHHLERGIALYDPRLHGSFAETHGIDPGIVCISYFGYAQWFLGSPDIAREYSARALANAERMGHPFTLVFALAFSAYLCQHLRDVQKTRDFAEKALVIASEHGFLHWKYQATILRGWALAELGQIDEGLEQIRTGLDAYEASESKLACPWFRSLLAGAYAKAGRPDAALRELDEALTVAIRNEEELFIPEICRLQGEIMRSDSGQEEADRVQSFFMRSLDLSRKHEALAWELRTSVSLARFWRDVGKPKEAANLLAPVCRRFNQGLDTPDVKEAVQLSGELDAG
jgi:tetratricopeptide (TPR) repeat protein